MKDIKTALDRYTMMMNVLPPKYRNGAWLLHGLLNEAIGDMKTASKSFEEAVRCDELSRSFLQKKENIKLEIFPLMNRLCTNFPLVEVTFNNHPGLVYLLNIQ